MLLPPDDDIVGEAIEESLEPTDEERTLLLLIFGKDKCGGGGSFIGTIAAGTVTCYKTNTVRIIIIFIIVLNIL